ncbi:MAG: hypothetical protein HY974_04495 [Candidatus Kerfeldbacteria bacterium]|nr:hypothetical protein [Candidatus Kerfeldbacteria bacterium]
MSKFKKAFSIGVTVLTVLWSVGVSFAPVGVSAAATAGDLIKMAGNSAVYYFDGSKRFVFPTESTYKSWYKDFSSVKTVPSSELQSYPLGGNVTIRPGTKLVKITTDPKVYAVGPGGSLQWVSTEAIALALYGSTWAKRVVDVPDSFFVNYKSGSNITSNVHPDGTVVKYANSTTLYYIEGGAKRPFASDAAVAANMIDSANAIETTLTYTAGSSITGKEAAVVNVSGSVGVAPAPGAGTGLSVALASDTPAATSIIADAANGGQALAPIAKFNFAAGSDGAVGITSLKLKKLGIVNDSSFSNVYLYDGSTRLAEMTSISSGVVTFTGTTSSPLFSVAAGTTKAVSAMIDLTKGTGAGITLGLGINTSADVVTNGATVSGTFPLSGSLMSTAVVTDLGKLTVANVSPAANNTVDAQDNLEVWKFSLMASNQNLKVSYIAVTNVGSTTTADLVNFKLYDGGTQLGSAVAAADANKKIAFDLAASPLLINSGITKQLSLKADIKAGATRTFKFSIQRSSDLNVVDTQYNVSLFPFPNGGVVGTWTVVQAGGATGSTINGGNLSVNKRSDSTSGNVALNGTSVTLAKFDLKASGEDVKITSLGLRAAVGAGANSGKTLKNVKLLLDGTQVGSIATTVTSYVVQNLAAAAADANDAGYTLGNSALIPSGVTKVLSVVGDLTGTGVATDGVQVALIQGTNNAQGQASLNSINAPAAITAGNALTIAAGALTAASNSSVSAMTVVVGAQNQRVGSVIFTAGSAEGIDLNSITITDSAGTAGESLGHALTNVKLMNGSTQLGATWVNPGTTAGTSNAFSISPALAIAASGSVQIDIYADILSGADITGNNGIIQVSAASSVGKSTTTTVALASAANLQTFTTSAGGQLTVSADQSTPQDQQVVMNSTSSTLGVWKLQANNAEALTVNQLIFVDNSADANSINNVKNLKLYADGAQVGNTVTGLSNVTNTTNTVVTLGAATTTIKLGADSSAVDSYYNGYYIVFLTNSTAGNDIGKVGRITGYVGATMVATITPVGVAFTNEDHAGATYKIVSGAVFSGIGKTVNSNDYKLFTLKGDVSDYTNATVALKNRFVLNTLSAAPTGAGTDTVIATGASSGAYATLANYNAAYAANNSTVYRTKLTASLNSASPSGTGKARTANDIILKADLAANSGYEVRQRAGYTATGFAAGDLVGTLDGSKSAVTVTIAGTGDCAAGATVGNATAGPGSYAADGAVCTSAAGAAATIKFTFGTNQDLSQVSGVSLFVNESAAHATTLDIHDTGGTTSNSTAFTPVAGKWYQVFYPISGVATANKDIVDYASITFTAAVGGETIKVAGLQLVYDYTKVNLSASANLVDGKLMTLRNDNNSTTIASGYSSLSSGAIAGFVYFIPTQTNSDFVVASGSTTPVSVIADTTALLGGTASLSSYINLGSSSSGTVTTGDIYWYDGATISAGSSGTIKWVNNTPNPLQGNSLSYS